MPLLIVNHHYYRENSTGRGIYPTNKTRILEEISLLKSNGWRIGDQTDLEKIITNKIDFFEKIAILTFDDGLSEQIEAVELLESYNIKPICFINPQPIIEKVVLDVHKLHLIRSEVDDKTIASDLDTNFSFYKQKFDNKILSNQYRYDNDLAKKIKFFLNFVIEKKLLKEWLNNFFESIFGSQRTFSQKFYMSESQIKKLGLKNMLGSHGMRHLPLGTLKSVQVEDDLLQSMKYLKKISKNEILGISYPYGGVRALNNKVINIAKKIGFSYGLSMKRGINFKINHENFLSLDRIDTNDLENWIKKI